MTVKLYVNGIGITCGVHRLVMLSFVGPPPEAMEVCHNNGLPHDNRLDNLRYDTRTANHLDTVRHGVHPEARKTQCKSGHPYDLINTIIRTDGNRDCRICRRERSRASRARRLALAGDRR